MRFFAGWAVILTLLGLVGRSASLVAQRAPRPKSTLQTAIGIKHPRIVQKAQGFMGGSFNTREFFHGRTVRLAARGQVGCSCCWCFRVPLAPARRRSRRRFARRCWLAAFLLQYLGLLAERWFFFAQANHPQNLYYQAVA